LSTHSETLKIWVIKWLHKNQWKPHYIGIFGSTARNTVSPRDYDLLIIVQDSKDNNYWQFINEQRLNLIRDAAMVFSIPLSPTVLSIKEVNESNLFTEHVMSHPIIHILGNLDDCTIKGNHVMQR
jgi:predicted nucleotidyltransferase